MSYNITVQGGTSVRLPTGGKYCEEDIIVSATVGDGGGGSTVEDLNAVLTEQEELIDELKEVLRGKAGGSGGVSIEGIPSGYAKCDYIKFNDAQIVDTGIVCTQNTKIKVLYTRESDTAMYMYGVVNDGNTASVTAYLSSGGSWRFGNKSTTRTITVSEEIIHTAIVTKTGIVSDGSGTSFSGVSNFTTIGTLIIGAVRNASGSVASAQYIGKILTFEMWDGCNGWQWRVQILGFYWREIP